MELIGRQRSNLDITQRDLVVVGGISVQSDHRVGADLLHRTGCDDPGEAGEGGRDLQHVVSGACSGEVGDGVATKTGAEGERVAVFATGQDVVADAAFETIDALAAQQRVVAGTPKQSIIAISAVEAVGARGRPALAGAA